MNFGSLGTNENEYMGPMYVLRELCEIKIEQANPICNLVSLNNFFLISIKIGLNLFSR